MDLSFHHFSVFLSHIANHIPRNAGSPEMVETACNYANTHVEHHRANCFCQLKVQDAHHIVSARAAIGVPRLLKSQFDTFSYCPFSHQVLTSAGI